PICAALFAVVALVLALTVDSDRSTDVPVVVGLIASLAIASRVRLYLGAGYAMPTQLALVPMLYLLPVPDVPLCVAAGLVLGAALGRQHPERLLVSVGDAWHSVGPAIVFLIAGEPAAKLSGWPVLALA